MGFEASANACDDGAAATCDNAAAVKFAGADAAANAAGARCPQASCKNVAFDTDSAVEAASKEIADGTPVDNAEYGFAASMKNTKTVVNTHRPLWPTLTKQARIMQVIS